MFPTPRSASHRAVRLAALAVLSASALASMPAHALYKVVGPDGKVTYTDRPPVSKEDKVGSVNAAGGGTSEAALPYELRQAAQRYPVVLYTTATCGPCESARQLLRQRGIPFTERTVATPADSAAMQRLTGRADLPAVTVGSQVIGGYNAGETNTYLDAAGYPKRSMLPANYVAPAASPLTSAAAPAAPAAASAPGTPAEPAAAPAPAAPGTPPGFKF